MAEIMRIDPAGVSPQLIDKAAEVIQGGGVIIYPLDYFRRFVDELR